MRKWLQRLTWNLWDDDVILGRARNICVALSADEWAGFQITVERQRKIQNLAQNLERKVLFGDKTREKP